MNEENRVEPILLPNGGELVVHCPLETLPVKLLQDDYRMWSKQEYRQSPGYERDPLAKSVFKANL